MGPVLLLIKCSSMSCFKLCLPLQSKFIFPIMTEGPNLTWDSLHNFSKVYFLIGWDVKLCIHLFQTFFPVILQITIQYQFIFIVGICTVSALPYPQIIIGHKFFFLVTMMYNRTCVYKGTSRILIQAILFFYASHHFFCRYTLLIEFLPIHVRSYIILCLAVSTVHISITVICTLAVKK